MVSDFILVLRWWGVLFALGLIFFPLTKVIFYKAKDSFYIFSKVLGYGIISYLALTLGTLHLLPFNSYSLYALLTTAAIVNIFIWKKFLPKDKFKVSKIIIFEELLFITALTFWAFIRAHEPSIHGLEKFMDYGFLNSILRTTYFPPKDIWFTPFSINYYYFGHLCAAVLTLFSGIPSNITYNLMIASLFALTAVGGFSLVYNFLPTEKGKYNFMAGILGGALLSLAGNLHTVYAFFTPYNTDHPVPPWLLTFLPNSFPNGYWYPNATRFIPFTIHEFPIYSFVVSDLHGHVSDIPFVLTTLALLFTVLKNKSLKKLHIILLSFLLAVMYMTNAWDGLIYLLLSTFVIFTIHLPKLLFHLKKGKYIFPISKITNIKPFLENFILESGIIVILYVVFTLPFSIFFKPFVSGIGVICAPEFLVRMQKLGPFLFEANHCQRSPFYQLLILYGFFYFFALIFTAFIIKILHKKFISRKKSLTQKITLPDNTPHIFISLLVMLSTILIIAPELIYVKDIYPTYYRANTMFKLVYQSFMLLSLSSAYIIVFFASSWKKTLLKKAFMSFTFVLMVLVFLFPYFAINSYYGNLANYQGLNGTAYLKSLYPGDLEVINFLNSHVYGQPVILEAQGDSYTDYARISANTGLPTVLGWTVHEWLWRGTYDVPAPRISEVQIMYTGNLSEVKQLLKKYQVKYAVIGKLEHEKYPNLNENNFKKIGKIIFISSDGQTKLYKLNV